ncbi:hypothetical protein BH24ACT3_BH24ACT3_09770 [soil metagenome]
MHLSAHGITTDLPDGWEGRITRRTDPADFTGKARSDGRAGWSGEREHPIAHLANFALPEDRGEFGSGAVDLMSDGHVFISLFEYGPESAGSELFSRQGLPRRLRPNMFSSARLQRTLPSQAGAQLFFTEAGRAFCLYVVIGAERRAPNLVPLANTTLDATRIAPR